jgi:DNA-binding IclR family transcriptional regulator
MAMVTHDVWSPDRTVALAAAASVGEPGQSHNLAKSAVRALDVLELFGQIGCPLRAVEINRYLGLSPSSANQILKTMVDSAYLVFEPETKRYCLSPRLAQFGGRLSAEYFGGDTLHALLADLQSETGETVTLAVRQGPAMQIVDVNQRKSARRLLGPNSRESRRIPKGLRVSLFGSAVGTSWLSTQHDEKIRELIRRYSKQLGGHISAVEVIDAISRARRRGYAFGGLSADDRVWSLAMPLPPSSSGMTLVLSITGPAEHMQLNRDKFVELMTERIADRLGPIAAG